jgi:anti-sigma-K factor RskA
LNSKEYIASGILEAYVLGELSGAELAEVEKRIAADPELRKELNRIEETHEKILMLGAVQPRASLKHEILDVLDKKKAANTKIIPLKNQSELKVWRFLAAASVSIAIIASYAGYTYWNKWKDTETNLNELIAQNQRMANEYSTTKNQLGKIQNDLAIITDSQFKRVILKGTDNAPDANVHVYWNETTHEVYMGIQNLNTLASDKQYQLWAIVDGKPVDAGVFDAGTGLIKMKDIQNAAAFAVTIEPSGGKASPTLETMQVVGNV